MGKGGSRKNHKNTKAGTTKEIEVAEVYYSLYDFQKCTNEAECEHKHTHLHTETLYNSSI